MAGAKPRLCVLIPSHWAAKFGGAELQVRMLVERLVSLDTFEVHFIARNIDRHHVPAGYELHRLPSHRPVAGTFLLDVPGLSRVLRRLQPDVIYQRVACAYTGTAAYFARKKECRMVWHVSSDRDLMPLPHVLSMRFPFEQLNKCFVDYGARHADAIIVQNSAQAELLRCNYGRSDAIHISNFHSAPILPPNKAQRSPNRVLDWKYKGTQAARIVSTPGSRSSRSIKYRVPHGWSPTTAAGRLGDPPPQNACAP